MRINLLPWRQQRSLTQLKLAYVCLLCLIITLSIITLKIKQTLLNSTQQHKQQLIQFTKQQQRLQQQLKQKNCLIINRVYDQAQEVQQHIAQQRYFTRILKQIALAMPQNLLLTSLTLNTSELTMEGSSASSTLTNQLVGRLAENNDMEQVQLTSLTNSDNSKSHVALFRFSIHTPLNIT